jgi:hypothetical protein
MRKLLRFIVAAAVGGVLAACGGSAEGPAPVSQTQGNVTVVSGTVTGFGSVIIDGVRYVEGALTVAHDVDGRSEAAGTLASVKVGQQVEAALDGQGQVTKLLVRAAARGTVEAVDVAGSTFEVAGQTIKVVASGDGATIFEGVSGLAALALGSWVEVHGTLDAGGNIVATRVEVASASGETRVRAAGLVKELTATTFKLGELTVNYAGATVKPDGSTIANDVLVVVYSDALPVANALTAKVVRVARKPSLEGREFHIGGLVADASADGRSFKVNGIRVDATSAELKGGQNPLWTDVKNMALVRVEGVLGDFGSGPVLKASRLWLVPASEQRRVVLIGQVTDFVSADKPFFKVRGTPVDASAAIVKNGKVGDIDNGTFVQVTGRIAGDVVKADEVKIDMPAKDVPFQLFGTVSDYIAADGTFKLLGIPMQLAADARFSGGAKADFGNGDVVSVKGRFDGVRFVVSEVEFRPSASVPQVHLEGVASAVSASSLVVNGATVKITPSTKVEGGALANGQRVEVDAQWIAGELSATKIEIEMPGAMAMLRGPISDYTSRADFKVNGQKVDATAAVLKDGTEAKLANGVEVRVKGTLAAGVVKATEVQFLR